jgi:hypothetical protein
MLSINSRYFKVLKNGKFFPFCPDGLPLKSENVFLSFIQKGLDIENGKLYGLDEDRLDEESQSGLRRCLGQKKAPVRARKIFSSLRLPLKMSFLPRFSSG